ncbi:MAG: hypothetical protein PHW01_00300 [Patescibacteria group bacterium]|nr:hypothetical protein [Patescibacteria group bacterium]
MKNHKQINLIGIDHKRQCLDRNNSLKCLLVKIIKKYSADLICEGFSEEVLAANNIASTIPQRIAKELNLQCIFCDPDEQVRKEIGYPTQKELREKFGNKSAIMGTEEYEKRMDYIKKFWPIRESYWLNKFKNNPAQSIIFICGSEHLKSFKSLLIKDAYKVSSITFLLSLLN